MLHSPHARSHPHDATFHSDNAHTQSSTQSPFIRRRFWPTAPNRLQEEAEEAVLETKKKSVAGKGLSSLLKQAKVQISIDEVHKSYDHIDTETPRNLMSKRVSACVSDVLWQFKAMCIMLVGVAVKLVLYNPEAPADAHYAQEQRTFFSLSLVCAFNCQFLYAIYILRRHYKGYHWISEHPFHAGILLARLMLSGLMIGLGYLELEPGDFMYVMVSCSVVQAFLVHFHSGHPKCNIQSDAQHPHHGTPETLIALRVKRNLVWKSLPADDPAKVASAKRQAAHHGGHHGGGHEKPVDMKVQVQRA